MVIRNLDRLYNYIYPDRLSCLLLYKLNSGEKYV